MSITPLRIVRPLPDHVDSVRLSKEFYMSKRAVLVVDLQNEYFPSGKLPLVGIDQAVANAARVIDGARAQGDPVIHIRHEFTTPGVPFFVPGTEGVQIHPAVAPLDGEQVVVKN